MRQLFLFVGLLCALVGCSQQQSDPHVAQLQNTVSQLQTTEGQLSDKITQLSFALTNENNLLNRMSKIENTNWNVGWSNITTLFGNIGIIWNAEQNAEQITASNVEVLSSNLQILTYEYNMLNSDYGSASINPEAKGYSNLKTPYGVLLISTENVEPYLDGFKVHLTIGNPTSASFHGYSLICSTYESTTNFFQTWHSITNEVPDTLSAGSWNKTSFVLAPATMPEVRNASVTLQLNVVNLLTPTASASQ